MLRHNTTSRHSSLTRRLNVKPVIAAPKGSILPTDLPCPIIDEGTFLEKMQANADAQIAIVVLTTEELICLVEKPHLFGVDVIALVGVPGGRYDAVWSTYIAPLRRVSLETLEAEVAKIVKPESEPPTGAVPDKKDFSMIRPRSEDAAPDEGIFE